MCIKPFLNPHFCNFYLGNSGLHADYNCRNILCAVVQTFVFTSNLRNFKIKLSCQKCKGLLTWGQKHPLSCPITSIIKPRSCKERQVQIKVWPWAQVSSFVTLFSEREEVFPLLFSKHNYFKITVKQADREPNISSGTHWNVSQVEIKRGLSCSVVCVSNFERNNFPPLLSGKVQFHDIGRELLNFATRKWKQRRRAFTKKCNNLQFFIHRKFRKIKAKLCLDSEITYINQTKVIKDKKKDK